MPKDKQQRGFFIFLSDLAIQIAKVSNLNTPLTIESLHEFLWDSNIDLLTEQIQSIIKQKPGNYSFAKCGITPRSQFFHKLKLESKFRTLNPQSLPEILKERFNIDIAENRVAVLSALDGRDYDPANDTAKEILFCGANAQELQKFQDIFVNVGIYPKNMNMGLISAVGGISFYSKLINYEAPLLFIEVDLERTQVVIIKNGQVEISHPINAGLNHITSVLQKLMNYPDESSAKRDLFSGKLPDDIEAKSAAVEKIAKEIKSYSGFYEVQTGNSINKIFFNNLHQNMDWVGSHISKKTYLDTFQLDLSKWLSKQDIICPPTINPENLHNSWLSLFSLMGKYH